MNLFQLDFKTAMFDITLRFFKIMGKMKKKLDDIYPQLGGMCMTCLEVTCRSYLISKKKPLDRMLMIVITWCVGVIVWVVTAT